MRAFQALPPPHPLTARPQLCTMFIAGLYYVERHHDLEQFTPTDKIPDLKADQPKEGPSPPAPAPLFPCPSPFPTTANPSP
jgi:hypothetical protein